MHDQPSLGGLGWVSKSSYKLKTIWPEPMVLSSQLRIVPYRIQGDCNTRRI